MIYKLNPFIDHKYLLLYTYLALAKEKNVKTGVKLKKRLRFFALELDECFSRNWSS